jgi:hypothetical protein
MAVPVTAITMLPRLFPRSFALRRRYLGLNAGLDTGRRDRLNRSSRCIRVMAVLGVTAISFAGCADSRLTANNAASSPGAGAQASGGAAQDQSPSGYRFTTDLYTELFRSNKRDDKSAPANDTSAPTSVSGPVAPVTVTSGTPQQDPSAPAPGVTRQEAAAPEAPPAQATVYGISSNGTTTDLYTELFGPRRRE